MGARPNWQQVVLPQYAAVPPELLALPQWVVWKRVQKEGSPKPTKVPYSAHTGAPASTTDSSTWATFDEAVAAKSGNDAYAGIGFVFTTADPYVGIDLDNCIDGVTGKLTSEAEGIVTAMDSYTERTPSGKGLHIIACGKLPAGGRKKGPFEIYETGRYFTMTGDAWPDTNPNVEDRTNELKVLHQGVFGSAKKTPEVSSAPPHSPASSTLLSDDEILAAIKSSGDAQKFAALYAGDWVAAYSSQSEADLALVSILAKHCGPNAAQIDRLFRGSGLYRDKWDERRGAKTYGEKTIAKALEGASHDTNAGEGHGGHGNKALCIDKFNAKYAVVRAGNGLRILEEHRDNAARIERVSLLNQADFGLAVKNWDVPGSKKTTPANWWLGQRERREYVSIDFNPGGAKEGEYNLWQGFPVTGQPGNCSLFWQFVEEVICAGKKELYTYIRRYMAHLIQRPGERPEIALVLRGGQGTGKNTFVEALGKLVTPYFKEATCMDQLTGRFNADLMQCILLHANEAYWGGTRTDAGKLKSMITDPTIPIEPKNVDRFRVRNCIRTIVSSNETWPVHIDVDDRRYFPLDLSDCHKQDKVYFSEIHAELEHGGLKALMYDLLHEDINGFHPRDKPRSPFGVDMKLRSADSATRWIHECLQEGYIVGQPTIAGDPAAIVQTWPTVLPKPQLGLFYRGWCHSQSERYPDADTVLFKKLRGLIPDIQNTRPAPTHGETRQRCIVFPTLENARAAFAKAIDADGLIEWEPK